MAQIDIIKSNAYVAVGDSEQIAIAKTNAYIAQLNVLGHTLIAKTNAYATNQSQPGHTLLAKTNAYGLQNEVLASQECHPHFLNGDVSQVFVPATETSENPKFTLYDFERNPYRPHIADTEDARWEDYREQQRILRQQHNITQAGDTTFDYGLLLKTYPDKEFTLGSLGRFFHDEFGLILARFVKLEGFVSHPFQGQPVGRTTFNNDEGVKWVVTNDIEKSSPDLAFGFTFFAETPQDGTYGWAVVAGPNPAQLKAATGEVPTQNAPYVWAALGEIGLGGHGRIMARTWGLRKKPGLPPGVLFIHMEGMSIQDMIDTVREGIEELNELTSIIERLDAHDVKIKALETGLKATNAELDALNALMITITNSLSAQIDILREQITNPHNWQIEIDAGDAAQALALSNAVALLEQEIANLNSRLTLVENTLAQYPLYAMQAQIDAINAYLSTLVTEFAAQIWMPVVDGSIPPTIIQNPDGNLVYIRIE